MDSIDELRRQLDTAELRLKAARDAYDEAAKRFHEALSAETGWLGKKATRAGRSIIVDSVSFRDEKPFKVTGYKLNRDGRPGRVSVSMIIDGEPIEFTDYEPPANGNGR
jgi:hypothetical protein